MPQCGHPTALQNHLIRSMGFVYLIPWVRPVHSTHGSLVGYLNAEARVPVATLKFHPVVRHIFTEYLPQEFEPYLTPRSQ